MAGDLIVETLDDLDMNDLLAVETAADEATARAAVFMALAVWRLRAE